MLLVGNTDISEIAANIKHKSVWNNGASVLSFEYPLSKSSRFENGETVVFRYKDKDIFYGFLFKSNQNRSIVQCTAYDQMRYLKASNSIMRQKQTLGSFVNDVCAQISDRIRLGQIDQTELNLGKYNFDNASHLDMIYQSIQDNLLLNGYYYTLRDNFGALDLRDTFDLRLPLIIGDGSLATQSLSVECIGDTRVVAGSGTMT